MYLQDWFENNEFKTMQDDGIFQKNFTHLCQMNKYLRVAELTTQVLIQQLCLRAKIFEKFVNPDPSIERYFDNWLNMFASESIIIHELVPDAKMVDLNTMLSANELARIELMAWRATPVASIEKSPTTTPKTLSSLHSVKPLSVTTIQHMSAIAHKNKYQNLDDFSARYIYHPITEAFSDEHKDTHGRLITLSINLSDYTNEEILDDLSQLLDRWRKATKTASKPDPSKVTCTNLRKIINNKYLLLLDGMIINRISGGAITDEQLIKQIYPHIDIQPDSFRKTYKRNARAFASSQCFTAWEKTLTNLKLWDQPVKVALQKKF